MRVGFIGLGDIGMPMAQRLIETGFDLVAHDIDAEKARGLVGASPADVIEDFRGCDVVGLAVSDDAAVESVLVDHGLLKVLGAGSDVLIHSTILPGTAQRLAGIGAGSDVTVWDAPVSGGAARARTGELTIMLGGPEPEDNVERVLSALASTTVPAGPVGAGAAIKLVNQLAMLAALAALQEGLPLAASYGADEAVVLRALGGGTGDSWVARNWGFFDALVRSYDAAGVPVRFRPWNKDLWDVVATARDAQLPVPLAGILAQYLSDAVETHAHDMRQGED